MRGFNDDSFIRREINERFCLFCDLSAFEQQSRFRALCNIFRAITTKVGAAANFRFIDGRCQC